VQHSPDYLTNTKLIKKEVIEIAKTIYTIIAIKPTSKQLFEKVLLLNEEQKNLHKLFYTNKVGVPVWKTGE
jgi:hypothetical protein